MDWLQWRLGKKDKYGKTAIKKKKRKPSELKGVSEYQPLSSHAQVPEMERRSVL